MKPARLPALLALLLCGPLVDARARLGETPEACARRYGPPSIIRDERTLGGELTLVYGKDGYEITINFRGNQANALVFKKTDRTGFTDAEAQALLIENHDDWTWSAPERYWSAKHDEVRVWGRTDGARAICPREGENKSHFTLVSHACWEKVQADKRAKEAKEKAQEWEYDSDG